MPRTPKRPSGARFFLRPIVLVAATLVALVACDDAPTEPSGEQPAVVASVSVSPGTLDLEIGDTVTLRAIVRSPTGDTLDRTVAWSTSDGGRATVTAQGRVTARSAGPVTISAAADGKSGQAVLEIAAPPPSAPVIAAFAPAEASAGGPDLTLTITGTGFQPDARLQWNGTARPTTWVSATEVRATVWAGDIAQTGAAQIQVVNPGHGTASLPSMFPIVVQQNPVARVEVRPALAITTIGAGVLLSPVVRDASGQPLSGRLVTYRSSNQLVATVNGQGQVTSLGEGEAVITVSSEGVEATSALSVKRDHLIQMLASDGTGLVSLDMRLGTPPTRFWQNWPGSRALDPSPSPDGRYIVYTIADHGTQLAVMDRLERTYHFVPGVGQADQPAWSPTADLIAFRRTMGDRSHIYTVRPDGSGLTNLTADLPEESSAFDPAWSPDGTRIVFAVQSTPGFHGLMTMNVDGSNKRALTSGAMDLQPAWLGDWVVFTRRDPWSGATDVWRTSVSGVGPFLRLTETGTAHSPAWSPDHRWIAYVDGPAWAGRGAIMAMGPFGEDPRPISLTTDGLAGGGLSPVWLVQR